MPNIQSNLHAIIGLGSTGLSCARYLRQQGIPFIIADTRQNPPNLEEIRREFPDVPLSLGQFQPAFLDPANVLVMSPGVWLKEPVIAEQIAKGKQISGDIELFAKAVKTPIIAITGTNAKSTVTTLVGKMAAQAAVKVQVGGNLGIPALDLLTPTGTDLFVLELSSFQLETTSSLAAKVATVLNVTPDHMDRYADLEDYRRAKCHIYSNCDVAVFNRDDPLTDCGKQYHHRKLGFTLSEPQIEEFGLLKRNNEVFLAFEDTALMSVNELPILGRHYQANALASLALGYGYGLPFDPMLQVLREFHGLPHRCQLVKEAKGVRWYNDSKGTNTGATLAAIEGLGSEIQGKLILIAGGVGKNADFSVLIPAIQKYVKAVVLIGEAAPTIAKVIGDYTEVSFANSMETAVALAAQLAQPMDSILLSPACASLDMFKNFEHRGQVFTQCVLELA